MSRNSIAHVQHAFRSPHTALSYTRNPSRPIGHVAEKQHHQVMKAVVIDGQRVRVCRDRAYPKLRSDQVLVKPVAVALNPTDWKHVRYGRAKDGCIVGCDYAGIVEAVGTAVTRDWQPGDRIFGCSHGANFVNPDDGVFSERAAVIGDLQMRIPESMSFEQAATLGLGLITVGQGLFQQALKLDLPSATGETSEKDTHVLIYGGGSSTATLGIQLAKLAGYKVMTTCKADRFDYVKSLGAEFAVDYTEEDAAKRIREYSNNQLRHVWDTISNEQSASFCANALSTSPSPELLYGTLNPVQNPRQNVNTTNTIMYTAFGRDFRFGQQEISRKPEDYDFAESFLVLAEKILSQGLLKPHIHDTQEGGLEGIVKGLQMLETGHTSKGKLVYRIDND
ncbi:hypothetical protein E8E14_003078 [Neopestalotiopsis sp. 37M]|nr:hypothetical protein E8E14_003078 [Neopestalotiopsis sp. 37M]